MMAVHSESLHLIWLLQGCGNRDVFAWGEGAFLLSSITTGFLSRKREPPGKFSLSGQPPSILFLLSSHSTVDDEL